MNELERLLIERDCTRVINDYLRFCDSDLMKAASLFTDDATLILEGRSLTYSGRREIDAWFAKQNKAWLAGRLVLAHMASQITVDVKDSDHAAAHALVMLFRSEWDAAQGPCPKLAPVIFDASDELVRTPEGWKMLKRVCSPFTFESPEGKWSNPWAR